MTLLKTIQDAAIAGDTPLAEVLRRCKVLSVRLGSRDFEQWVDNELNGYPNDGPLPDYRLGDVESLGSLVGVMGRQAKNVPIPPSCVPPEYREKVRKTQMRQPIGSYEDLLQGGHSGTFQAPWPGDLIRLVSQDVYQDMSLIAAWQQIPRGMIVGLVDSVRNRILSFALEIERVAPNAGAAGELGAPPPADQVKHVFQTIIYGNVGNLAAGSTVGSQHAKIIVKGDFDSLTHQLRELGFDDPTIGELKSAIKSDGPQKVSFGKATAQWLGKALGKIAEGALKVSIETGAKVLPSLLSQYLGLPPASL